MLHEELSTDMVCIIKYPCFACKLFTNIILQDRITQLQDAILDASFHSPIIQASATDLVCPRYPSY